MRIAASVMERGIRLWRRGATHSGGWILFPHRHSRDGGNPDGLTVRLYRCGSEVMDSRLRGNDERGRAKT
ncbi:hypothetical protein D9602_03830 [Sphingomonas sp. TX0522]|nr:hypothetical protein [Sphingomonas sp. TX0522]